MTRVYPKKNLGQHFLKDKSIAMKIAGSLTGIGYSTVLEIGPGTGILTDFILKRGFRDFRVIEIDNESVHFLKEKYPDLPSIITGDFLKYDIESSFYDPLAVIGNFPYNISSQILFRVLEHKDKIVEVCGMLQKEVAERICAGPGTKAYGILSVLLQAYYSAEYLFTVSNLVFTPPPKVKSGVIRLRRNGTDSLPCNEELFPAVVKACFNQRRKILRNSIKSAFNISSMDFPGMHLRPEQLSVSDFVKLTGWIESNLKMSE
jgi:16S rRNA (adenine1518-N6/adenine1519-N6)-dimethyltransferase